MRSVHEIQIISAPCILGLKPGGVERLPESLLSNGLKEKLNSSEQIITLASPNQFYSRHRSSSTDILNQEKLREFCTLLMNIISTTVKDEKFPLVLGGDCSILIGVMAGLKFNGKYGLFFLDAHADFYEPEKSTTGEAADMDLAIISGRGPDILTNLGEGKPYLPDRHVIHIGQRDWQQTRQYGSQDIKDTAIKTFDNDTIQKNGVQETLDSILAYTNQLDVEGYWIHFDTDVLSDEENPAVDYRLKGGLSFIQCQQILRWLLRNQKIAGMTITIFNPDLDKKGIISGKITNCLQYAFT
jgi:arginase